MHGRSRPAQPRALRIRRASGRSREFILPAGLPAFNLVGLPETEVRRVAIGFAQPCKTRDSTFLRARLPLTSRPPIYRRNPAASTCPSRWEFSPPPDRFQRMRSSVTNLRASWR